VAENKEQTHARRIAQILEKLRGRLKGRGILRRGMQMMLAHRPFSLDLRFRPNGRTFRPKGKCCEKGLAFAA